MIIALPTVRAINSDKVMESKFKEEPKVSRLVMALDVVMSPENDSNEDRYIAGGFSYSDIHKLDGYTAYIQGGPNDGAVLKEFEETSQLVSAVKFVQKDNQKSNSEAVAII